LPANLTGKILLLCFFPAVCPLLLIDPMGYPDCIDTFGVDAVFSGTTAQLEVNAASVAAASIVFKEQKNSFLSMHCFR
jgi:hypothetical protein